MMLQLQMHFNLLYLPGGRKASFAAIRLGHGGQQNKQHNSLKLEIKELVLGIK